VALLVCPRCLTAGLLQVFEHHRVVYTCRACDAVIEASEPKSPLGFVPKDGCQCVIWRIGDIRCELWSGDGASYLRVYDAAVLLHEEPFIRGKGWAIAASLKLQYTGQSGE